MAIKANRVVRVVVIIIFGLASSLLLYLLINNFQFVKGRTVRVHFSSIGDLNTGSLVRRAGIKVGTVTRLAPAPDEKSAIVTLTFEVGRMVRQGDQFALVSKGILGDMYIEQKPGNQTSPEAEEGRLYEGIPAFSIGDLLSGDTMGLVTDLADSLKSVVDILRRNQSSLDSSLKDIARTAHNTALVTERAVELTQSVPDMARQITASIDELKVAVTDVATKAQDIASKLDRNLTTGSDDLAASMKSLRHSSEAIQRAVDQLTAQNSVIARIGSPSTAQSLETTIKNLEEVSKNLVNVTRNTDKIVTGVSSIFDSK